MHVFVKRSEAAVGGKIKYKIGDMQTTHKKAASRNSHMGPFCWEEIGLTSAPLHIQMLDVDKNL